jgi:hypothetical protein
MHHCNSCPHWKDWRHNVGRCELGASNGASDMVFPSSLAVAKTFGEVGDAAFLETRADFGCNQHPENKLQEERRP